MGAEREITRIKTCQLDSSLKTRATHTERGSRINRGMGNNLDRVEELQRKEKEYAQRGGACIN